MLSNCLVLMIIIVPMHSIVQVCALLWSKDYRELVSSHGFAHYQLTLWKYPSLNKVAELTGRASKGGSGQAFIFERYSGPCRGKPPSIGPKNVVVRQVVFGVMLIHIEM